MDITKLSKKEKARVKKVLAYYLVMKHPIAFRDFWMPKAWRPEWKTRYYQYGFSLFDEAVIIGGRSQGKSKLLESELMFKGIDEPLSESLISSLRRTHLKDRLENVISYASNVDYLREFFLGNTRRSLKVAVNRTPTYILKYENKHIIRGISTGDDPMGTNIQGTHPHIRYLEETQMYPKESWDKFQSTEDPKGARDKFVGVSDGRRESPLYQIERMAKFKNKIFHIPRLVEPYWTQEKKANLSFNENSAEYDHQILAEWGEPVWSLWNEGAILDCLDQSQNKTGQLKNHLKAYSISGEYHSELRPSQVLSDLPKVPEADVILGIDYGYSSPTTILPFYYSNHKWNLTFYIELIDKMIPDTQAIFLDYIADYLQAKAIGIDFSGGGVALATSLMNPKNNKFSGKNYDKRIFKVEFNSSLVVGYKEGEEVKEKVKPKTTQILTTLFQKKIFKIYHSEELLAQFCSERQKRSAGGNLVIDTPSDVHIPDAFRCFAFVYFHRFLLPELKGEKKRSYRMVFPSFGKTKFKIFGRR